MRRRIHGRVIEHFFVELTTLNALNHTPKTKQTPTEAYIKDLLKGNPLQGAIEPSPLVVRPARSMDAAFARFLDAITIEGIAAVAGLSTAQVEAEVAKLQRAVEPSFQRRAAFPSDDLSNEYALDCRTYVEFRVAAKLIPNLNARAAFVQTLGSRVLDKVRYAGVCYAIVVRVD